MLTRFIFEEDGQSLIEYGLLLSLIALVIVVVLAAFGNGVANMYSKTSNKLPG
jgi:pilus assembly protein Flp/PilA